jgi:adenosylmethionine-8-amino-7-oxononanoate aminotransferase
MAGIELVRNRDTRHPYAASDRIGMRTIMAARRCGVILRPLGNVIVLMPPLCITEDEIDFLCSVTREAIRTATEAS